MTEQKALITNYLRALSGNVKTPGIVREYVVDTKLLNHIAEVEAAFPRYELLADDMLQDGDLVVVRGTFRGVHQGPFAGIEPTGKSASAGLIIIYRIEGGKIVDHWLQFDLFALVQQLQINSEVVSA